MMPERPSLQLTDAVIFQKNTRREILREVNLYAYPGDLIYLVGRVGSGKSSLLKTLYGELPLLVGRGQIAGFALHTLPRKRVPYLRRQLGIVFQEASLLDDCTVYQNLEFVLRATNWRDAAAIDNRIWHVLALTGMEHKAHAYPDQLSGGERQRAGIARALLNSPQIVLADEPTANLDPDTAREVMELFRGIADEGRTVIISTHNMANVRQYPGRTWLLEGGYVTELEPDALL
jgi:cell division transport system ATP-binding protein